MRALSSWRGSPRATMIYQSAPHRVLKISELTRLIASQLVLESQKSTVNLACVCRYLEEPVLGTLWETQHSFCTLLEVLSEDTLDVRYRGTKRMVRGLVLSSEKSNA